MRSDDGIASIVAGAICAALALLKLQEQRSHPIEGSIDHTLPAILYFAAAGGLVVAGILALASCRKFKAWRNAQRGEVERGGNLS